jgi:hypothetical protein
LSVRFREICIDAPLVRFWPEEDFRFRPEADIPKRRDMPKQRRAGTS